jgi:hypothetical protein
MKTFTPLFTGLIVGLFALANSAHALTIIANYKMIYTTVPACYNEVEQNAQQQCTGLGGGAVENSGFEYMLSYYDELAVEEVIHCRGEFICPIEDD